MRVQFDTNAWHMEDHESVKKKLAKRSAPKTSAKNVETKSDPMERSESGMSMSQSESLVSILELPVSFKEGSQYKDMHEEDKSARSPLSQVFEDLFFSGNEKEKYAGTPVDLSFGEFLANSGQELEVREADSNPQFNNLDSEILQLIDRADVFDDGARPPPSSSLLSMTYHEENMMLKHFFQKLLPLLDAHPQSPWPALALRYCDFDVARSCFISLACIHIYESRQGGKEYYKKGIAHIHSTMSHLIQSISNAETNLKQEDANPGENGSKTHIQSFVILVLVNVHILFAVLQKGQSSLARYLLKVFGSLCQDQDFYQSLMCNESKGSLVVVLSWYDTVAAVVSPDCRLPYCSPDWYGLRADPVSTLQMMGCPGEIFKALLAVCFLRHEIHSGSMVDDEHFQAELEDIKDQLLRYRDYVDFKDGQDYALRLKGAQCWSLAVYVTLLRLFRNDDRNLAIREAVNEFIDIYGSMPSESPTVTQMVWPVYAIGCECRTDSEKDSLRLYMKTLYETAQMGTLASLTWVVEQVWKREIPQEEVLQEWLEEGVDYYPL